MKLGNLLYSNIVIYLIIIITMSSFCYFGQNIFIANMIKYCNIVLFLIISLKYIITRNKSKFSIALLLYIILLLISTKMSNYPNILGTFRAYYVILTLSLYLDMGLKEYAFKITNILYKVLFIIIFVNFLTIILFPNGMYTTIYYSTNWFLGYDNTHIAIYLPAIMIMMIKKEISNKWNINYFLLIGFITYSVFFCFSANSVVVYSIILFYILYREKIDQMHIMNIKNYIIMYLAIFLGIVILRLQNLFSWFIVKVLGKNLTFTGRVHIWDRIIDLIKNKFILGYGKEKNEIISAKLGHKSYSHAHNTILDILYKGGIVSLLIMSYIVYICSKELTKFKNNKIAKIISIILFDFLIMSVFEARQEKIGLYIILVYAYNVRYLIKSKELDKNE